MTTPQGMLELADRIKVALESENVLTSGHACMLLEQAAAALRLSASPAGNGNEADCLASVAAALKPTETADIDFIFDWQKSVQTESERREHLKLFRDQIINVAAGEMFSRLTAVAPDGAREAVPKGFKPVYVKRWRTLIVVSEAYADKVREALALPAVVGIEGRDTVTNEVYESAVKGRQDFRDAYRRERDENKVLHDALKIADEAINPPDRSGISLDKWNQRLKAATAQIRAALARHPHQPVEDKRAELQRALLGDDPDLPEQINPLGWLHTMIEECKRIAPTLPEDADPSAWYEMVNEVQQLHDRAKAALTHPLEPATEAGEPHHRTTPVPAPAERSSKT